MWQACLKDTGRDYAAITAAQIVGIVIGPEAFHCVSWPCGMLFRQQHRAVGRRMRWVCCYAKTDFFTASE
jgi:hypothetical protein